MQKMKVGIIGCGTIGSELARAVTREFRRWAVLHFICDHHSEKALLLQRALPSSVRIVSWETLVRRSDLVIEAASASISARVAAKALKRDKQVLIMSVGGLLEDSRWARILKQTRGKLWIPSGAVAGVDALLAARQGTLRRVQLITSKPPQGLAEAPYFKKKKFPVLQGAKTYCLFRGKAREAVRAFPQNVNVAAVLALAGIGAEKTEVEIWTSKTFRRNRHEITIEGNFGSIHTCVENIPAPRNPKTSYLAVLSACAVLEKIFSPLKIGT